ncbi:MAG: type I glyceraldehyde-3-phosphate dehydrogenase [Neisseria sp.]|nr:type I glyceraldehyde-3-phosphate dehydrogenase [Neisseria sp.]
MSIRVAINGFGRIGRLALRQMSKDKDIEVVAVNDLTPAEMLLHLFKYDSTQGRFAGTAEAAEGGILVNGRHIKVLSEPDPQALPWGELKVDAVLECTGFFTKKDKAQAHIRAGARKVLVSAPAGDDVKTVVYGVNEQILDGGETVVSAASCTTNCLAPMAAVLQREFGVVQGLMTTVHAYTGDQNTLDAPHRKGDLRRARAAGINIVPNSTGAAKAIGLVIPSLNGKLAGSAQRVPVATGSLTELVCVLEKTVDEAAVNAAMKAASGESFAYTEDPIVSSDVIGLEAGALFDATQTRILTVDGRQLVKTVSWYDNEMSYTCQLLRVLRHWTALAAL